MLFYEFFYEFVSHQRVSLELFIRFLPLVLLFPLFLAGLKMKVIKVGRCSI